MRGEGRGVYRALTADLDAGQHERLLRAMTDEETREADWDWSSWAHRGQEPHDLTAAGLPWRTWVLMAGRGFGKTLAGAQWITAQIAAWPDASREPLRASPSSAPPSPRRRRVMVEGSSGLLDVADAWVTRMASEPAPAHLPHRRRRHALLRRQPRTAPRPRTSSRLVRRARQVGEAAGDLGHAAIRPSPRRLAPRPHHHHPAPRPGPAPRSSPIPTRCRPAARPRPTRTPPRPGATPRTASTPAPGSAGRSWTGSC